MNDHSGHENKHEYYTFPLGEIGANCYIVDCGGGTAAVIDPGDEAEVIVGELERLHLCPGAVLITHGHFDHVGAARELSARYGCRVWMSRADLDLPEGLAGDAFCTDGYGEGDRVTVGDAEFAVISTPGHSRGSVCLILADLIFTGDTLFYNSCGRTDFPGGSAADMRKSLARLVAMPGNYTVLPGHGAATSLERERRGNPFMIRAAGR